MKKTTILAILAISFATLSNSCNEKKEVSKPLTQENSFVNLINKSENEYNQQPNEIKQEEYLKNYDKKITDFLLKDSIIISNWTGTLSKLNSYDHDNFKEINFQIEKELKPKSEYDKLSLDCTYLVKNSEIGTDKLYKKISNLTEFSNVYYTGIFVKNNLNQISPDIDSYSMVKDLDYFSSPKYKFYILDISPTKNPKISSNLYESIKLNRQVFDLLNDKAEKKIKDNEWKSKTKELTNKALEIEKKLTEDEKKINNLTKNYFSSEFM